MSGSPMDHVIALLTRFTGNVDGLHELVDTLVQRVDQVEAASRKRPRAEEDDDEGEDFQLSVLYAAHYRGQHIPPPEQQSWPALVEAINAQLALKEKAVEENMWAKHQARGEVKAVQRELEAASTQVVEYRNRAEHEQRLGTRAREEAAVAREAMDALRAQIEEASKQRALEAREQERELKRLRRACDGHEIEMAHLREEMSREAVKAAHQYTTDIGAAKERTVRHDAHRDKRIAEMEVEIARLRMIAAIGVQPPPATQPPIVAPRHHPHPQQQQQPVAAEDEFDLQGLDFAQLRADITQPASPTYTPGPPAARPHE